MSRDIEFANGYSAALRDAVDEIRRAAGADDDAAWVSVAVVVDAIKALEGSP